MTGKSDDQAIEKDEELRKHRDELLDEALKETFPASDPTSIAGPDDDLHWRPD